MQSELSKFAGSGVIFGAEGSAAPAREARHLLQHRLKFVPADHGDAQLTGLIEL